MTGIILAGGKNIRIGLNKALLKINSGTIIEYIIKVINPIFSQILIVTNSPKDFEFLRVKIVKDATQGGSPLAGIYSGLIYSKNYHNFFFACDMPFINPDLIKFMIEESGDYEVTIPRGNMGFEPLHAIYSKGCIKAIREQLESNNFKITDFFSKIRVKFINQSTIDLFDPDRVCFFNINTRSDYLRALEITRKFCSPRINICFK